MSIIVTAASGHLGALIVEALLARGAAPTEVTATSRDASKLPNFAGRGIATAALDYSKPETVTAVVKPGDVLVLVSSDAVGQRFAQHSAVITAAKEAGISRVVYTSAPHATTSALILAPEHKATEEFIVASGVPYTFLRNGWYTENYAGEVAKGRVSGEITASVGDGRVASASRKDYAEAAAVAALDDSLAGRTFELSGDYAWNWDELATAVSDIAGTSVTYRALTPEQHTEMLKVAGLDDGTIGFIVALDGNIRDGLLAETSGDLNRLIGHPTEPLVEGLSAAQ
ncbi:MAG TPA: NAD(P)-dependent oxidoreductase [Microbacteriaceae bacterium]|nr:NAD(P)-dependent oxidoreductase [Microbacteriaceae bacterium]